MANASELQYYQAMTVHYATPNPTLSKITIYISKLDLNARASCLCGHYIHGLADLINYLLRGS